MTVYLYWEEIARMGTRGFVGFVVDGTEKIAYNHFDSYPSGLGRDVLNWLHEALSHGQHRDSLVASARSLRVVDPKTSPSAEDIERLRAYADLDVGSQDLGDWYVLLRKTQGEPGEMLQAGVIEDAGEFPANSLFAEWGYIIDFDDNVFEVYQGFQVTKHDQGRFADRSVEPSTGLIPQYYPVALVASWPLDRLPSAEEFMVTVDPEGTEEDPDGTGHFA